MSTNLKKYISTIEQGPAISGDFVQTLSNEERIILREELEKTSYKDKMVRPLFYNYSTQEWI